MRSTIGQRFLFALTVLATLSMIGADVYARGGRGRAGGGRSGGGRAAASGGRSVPTRSNAVSPRPSGANSALSNRAGQLGAGQFSSQRANAGGLSSQAANLKSGLANSSQLQGMLQQQSGQAKNNLSQRNGQFQQTAQTKANQIQNGAKPFSASWYAQHPNAWQATHPHADAALVASAAAVTAWVGAPYYAPASSGGSSTTVVYTEAPSEAETAQAETFQATQPMVAANVVAPASPAQNAAADTWLPVGIYALSTTEGAPAQFMLQLLVDHQGTLRGVYYDSITNTTHNLVGTLNTSTQVAQWQLESNAQVSFQARLDQLTQPTGALQVNLPAGPQKWLLARVEEQQ